MKDNSALIVAAAVIGAAFIFSRSESKDNGSNQQALTPSINLAGLFDGMDMPEIKMPEINIPAALPSNIPSTITMPSMPTQPNNQPIIILPDWGIPSITESAPPLDLDLDIPEITMPDNYGFAVI